MQIRVSRITLLLPMWSFNIFIRHAEWLHYIDSIVIHKYLRLVLIRVGVNKAVTRTLGFFSAPTALTIRDGYKLKDGGQSVVGII